MGNPPCNWARARLPLLVGDELVGAERRRVERHLIGCPRCRAHRVALGHALEVMHAAAAESAAGAGGRVGGGKGRESARIGARAPAACFRAATVTPSTTSSPRVRPNASQNRGRRALSSAAPGNARAGAGRCDSRICRARAGQSDGAPAPTDDSAAAACITSSAWPSATR